MHLSTIAVAAISAVAPLASAHGPSVPRIIGLDIADLNARKILSKLGARFEKAEHSLTDLNLESRDSKLECGPGIGSCSDGKCCSRAGYCGTADSYCYSPGCKYQYGPGCPENKPPSGTNTSSIPRSKVGSVPYGGTGIFRCTKPGTIALTFDDGPQKVFTDHILDLFKSYNAKATFFITGNNINKGQIDTTAEHVSAIKRMESEGHQIAVHTWTHLDLSKDIAPVDRRNQIWMVEMAIRNIIGKIPTYMRPPYSSCTPESGCEQDMADMGYHVINFNVDTDDYNQITSDKIQNSKDWFKGNITKNGATAANDKWLSIAHDIVEQTANNLTEYMLSTLTQLGYKAVTVGECLGDPEAYWYRTPDGKFPFVDSPSNNTNPNNTNPNDPNPSNTPPNDTKSNNTVSNDNKTNDTKSNDTKSGSASLLESSHGLLHLIAPILLFSVAFLHVL